MKIPIQIAGEQHELNVTRQGNRLTVKMADGKDITVEPSSSQDGYLTLNVAGRTLRIAGTRQDGDRQIWVNGHTLTYKRIDPQAGDSSSDSGSLSASIPAVVSAIQVSVGDEVSAGDKLILLESMKMIIPIQATQDGIVSEILCNVGDAVQPGVPLISLGQLEND